MSRRKVVEELHRNVRKNFVRRSYIMTAIDDTFQADLIEMRQYATQNKGYKYILVVIDTFSKYVWTSPLIDKSGLKVTNAMKSIFDRCGRICRNLHTDKGKEFFNVHFKNLMKLKNINHYSTFTNKKASIVERLNRTLLGKLWQRFTLNGNQKWLNEIRSVTSEYNNTKHSTIKMKPVDVTKSIEHELLTTVYKKNHTIDVQAKQKFKINDEVRISKSKTIFEKGYKPNWSTELFTITNVHPTQPITYTLKDMNEQTIKGKFYDCELMKTEEPNVFLVERIIRRKNGMCLVKWLGFGDAYNTWIEESDLI